jgi:hypothetical protein
VNRCIYADPALHDGLGHHADFCRVITTELRARGIEPIVLAHAAIQPQLQAEFGAHAHFRGFPYFLADADPICGWLNAFDDVAKKTCDGLLQLDLACDDLIFFNGAQPGVMMGVVNWLSGLPPDAIPRVVMEFATDPGVDVVARPRGTMIDARDPRIDPRGVLYRFAACRIPAAAASRLHLMTFEHNASAAYAALFGRPVGVLPYLQHATTERRNRAGSRPVTIAALGHQRADKGYQVMPEVTRLLLQSCRDIRVLVHNGSPSTMPEAQQAMRILAAADQRVLLDERVVDPATWSHLLAASDLIVCPYPPARYALSYSGVMTEAIANAIPVVVPGATALSRLLRECGNPGTTFDGFDAASVAAATRQALEHFDGLAHAAHRAATLWPEKYGPAAAVGAILSAGEGAALSYPTTISLE